MVSEAEAQAVTIRKDAQTEAEDDAGCGQEGSGGASGDGQG